MDRIADAAERLHPVPYQCDRWVYIPEEPNFPDLVQCFMYGGDSGLLVEVVWPSRDISYIIACRIRESRPFRICSPYIRALVNIEEFRIFGCPGPGGLIEGCG